MNNFKKIVFVSAFLASLLTLLSIVLGVQSYQKKKNKQNKIKVEQINQLVDQVQEEVAQIMPYLKYFPQLQQEYQQVCHHLNFQNIDLTNMNTTFLSTLNLNKFKQNKNVILNYVKDQLKPQYEQQVLDKAQNLTAQINKLIEQKVDIKNYYLDFLTSTEKEDLTQQYSNQIQQPFNSLKNHFKNNLENYNVTNVTSQYPNIDDLSQLMENFTHIGEQITQFGDSFHAKVQNYYLKEKPSIIQRCQNFSTLKDILDVYHSEYQDYSSLCDQYGSSNQTTTIDDAKILLTLGSQLANFNEEKTHFIYQELFKQVAWYYATFSNKMRSSLFMALTAFFPEILCTTFTKKFQFLIYIVKIGYFLVWPQINVPLIGTMPLLAEVDYLKETFHSSNYSLSEVNVTDLKEFYLTKQNEINKLNFWYWLGTSVMSGVITAVELIIFLKLSKWRNMNNNNIAYINNNNRNNNENI